MKILIVDDNNTRVGQIIGRLERDQLASRDDVHVAAHAQGARDALMGAVYDLLLLDVLLPLRPGDAPTAEAALDLLVEISDVGSLRRPRHIVGITACAQTAEAASSSFSSRTWTLIHADELSSEWLSRLERCVAYIRDELLQSQPREFETDVLVVAALRDPEMNAVLRLPWNWQPETPLDDTQFFHRGTFESSGRTCSVVAVVAPRMGMLPSALLAAKAIEKFRPRVCVMPGICAGIAGRANIGDVIFSDVSWDYQCGKYFVDDKNVPGFSVEPYQLSAELTLSAKFDQLAQVHEFTHSIWRGWDSRPRNPPELLRGPVASGSAVLADSSETERIVEQQRKVRGVEMELYGVFYAAQYAAAPRPRVMGLKAVCDFADESKSDDWQKYCAYVSARVMQEYFERYMGDLMREQ